ncbi:MAG TPA: hypothetical protein VLA49_17860 [Anaerolineales bacterium]|nr:hypothetical protein [Anaerolineales bacterium]
MKKTIWIPIVGGFIFGALSYLTTVANLTIQVSEDLILGPWEIFNTISAALLGPIGLLITELGLDISGYVYFIRGVYPAPQDIYFLVGNYIAHIAAMLFIAFGYRFIHQRTKMPRLLAGWILLMGIYYLVGVTLSVILHNIAVPGLGATYVDYFSNVRLEFIIITVITSLLLLALPERYRKPQWYELKKAPDRSGEVQEI